MKTSVKRYVFQQPIRVLYTSRFIDLKMGGQKSMVALIEHLDRTKVTPLAAVPREGELSKKLKQLNCEVYYLSVREIRNAYLWKRWKIKSKELFHDIDLIRRFLLDHKIDIVHTDEESDATIFGIATRGTRIRHVYHARVVGKSKYDHFLPFLFDAMLGVSDATKKRFPSFLIKKYLTVYDGVDCSVFKPVQSQTELRKTLGLPLNKLNILFTGQLKKGKGILDLLDALGQIKSEGNLQNKQDWYLSILGKAVEDEIEKEIAYCIAKHNLGNEVQLVGHQINIDEWMKASDILVLVSHEGVEGLPRVIFEAMACGVVPIGSRTSGVEEVFGEQTGLLVAEKSPTELKVALLELMNQPKLLEILRRNAIEHARNKFDIKKHASVIENLYLDWLSKT